MSYSTITWAGVSSDSIGCNLKIERYPDLNRPRRKMDVYSVPGRNGDLILPQDAWENYTQKYEIYAGDGVRGASPEAFVAVAAWLYGPSGYQKLIDSYEPEYYRLAYYEGGLDVANSLSRFGRATIEFVCRPERFLINGEQEIVYTPEHPHPQSWISFVNPTQFASKPVLKVTCTSTTSTASSIVILSDSRAIYPANHWYSRINIEPTYSGTMYIDSQSLDCYDASGNNLNSYVSFWNYDGTKYAFPSILPGMCYVNARSTGNALAADGFITEVAITPNWWTL